MLSLKPEIPQGVVQHSANKLAYDPVSGNTLFSAKQLGDATLPRNAGKRPNPHSFTHGTSAQRQRWFATGYENATIQSCDTFSTDRL